ncbi:MAG: MMPL family transporter [Solirubrobacteraceae bacterium]|nr:MMPL family transporter [Solirubrobacteraceae bacterium]
MPRLTDVVLRHRRVVAAVWILLTLAGAGAAAGINDALSRTFDAPGRPAFDANGRIVGTFGNGGLIAPIVVVATPDGDARVTDRGVRSDLRTALEEIADAVPRARIASTLDAPGGAFDGSDGRSTFALVFPPLGRPSPDENPEALAAVRRVASQATVGGAPLRVTGIEALTDDGGGGGIGLLAETVVGGLGAMIVLAWAFGSALALVPLVVAGVSILTTFLLLRGLTLLTDVSFVVQFLVALIGLGVAIDYSLLVVFRWREERARGRTGDDAVRIAMRTAGRAVAVSGVTVGIGLLALVVVPVPFIRSIGFGGLLIPVVSVLASLTVLPVLLSAVGERIDRRWARRHAGGSEPERGRGWYRWSAFVVRRRWWAAAAGLALLIALAAVATTMRPGDPSVDALSSGGQARTALQQLERDGLGAGALTPIEVVVPADRVEGTAERLRGIDGVRAVVAVDGDAWSRDGSRIVLALPQGDSASDEGRTTIDALRDRIDGDGIGVGGPAAQDRDLTEAIYASFPIMLALIALVTFALLARALRSWVLPIKAVLLNVLSVGSSFGIVVLVWQEGLGSDLIGGVPGTGAITTWVPLAIFAFLYGLSMDYEVFILSRVREEYDESGDTDDAIVRGLGHTGKLVTTAALILFLAFVAMAAAPSTELRILATGLAAGIILDATIVRALVVPALVTLFGDLNWWEPAWVARRRERRAARGR